MLRSRWISRVLWLVGSVVGAAALALVPITCDTNRYVRDTHAKIAVLEVQGAERARRLDRVEQRIDALDWRERSEERYRTEPKLRRPPPEEERP